MASNIKLINFVFDSICFIAVLTVLIVIKITLYGTTEGLYPTKQGFLCGDTSIQKPIKEDYLRYEVVCTLSYIIPIVVVSCFAVWCLFLLTLIISSVRLESKVV